MGSKRIFGKGFVAALIFLLSAPGTAQLIEAPIDIPYAIKLRICPFRVYITDKGNPISYAEVDYIAFKMLELVNDKPFKYRVMGNDFGLYEDGAHMIIHISGRRSEGPKYIQRLIDDFKAGEDSDGYDFTIKKVRQRCEKITCHYKECLKYQ